MKSNTKWLLICIGIVLSGVVVYSYQDQVGVGRVDSNTVLIQRGILMHDPESMPSADWLLEYQDVSSQPQYISLVFDEASLCLSSGGIETCDITKYQNQQPVQVEGFLRNGQFYVARMLVISDL